MIVFWLFYKTYLANLFYINLSVFSIFITGSFIFPFYVYSTARAIDVITRYIATIKTRFIYFCLPDRINKLRDTREKLIISLRNLIDNNLNEIDENYNNRVLNLNDKMKEKYSTKIEKEDTSRNNYFIQSDSLLKPQNERH